MNYFLSAGEASGDLHAAQLVAAIKRLDSEARFTFLGGDLMAEAAGAVPLIHYSDMAYMGFCEVVRHLPQVLGNLKVAKNAISEKHPDAVILVDYPSFNLKLAAHAHSLGIPVYYYISPKVWAWKEYRVKDIKRYVRRLFSILPFEVEFFRRHGYEVDYVGNPSVEEIKNRMTELPGREAFCTQYKIELSRPYIALVPGSRRGEIRNNLPIMAEVARRFPDYQAVVAGAPGIDPVFYSRYTKLPVVGGVTFELMSYATAALVTSGTATLEAAILGVPQVVCYRANGSRLSYELFKRILKIPFVSLPNLIAGHEVVHEALVYLCTPDIVERELRAVLPGGGKREEVLDGYKLMLDKLGDKTAAMTAAGAIIADLKP